MPAFDANLDKMCFANSQTSDGAYTVSSSVSWDGAPGHTGSSADVTFYAVDAMMNFSELGTLAIERWVRKKGEKMRGHSGRIVSCPFRAAVDPRGWFLGIRSGDVSPVQRSIKLISFAM